MLEVRDLVKIYVTKGAKPVRAIDGVSIRFEETGMVFLLGKSGSGKSTLLNLCGGLDTPDEGEIIIKGRSSKDFTQSDFDSYRNTYVGFVFQEYNILEEFSVEDNIALALELQGRKNHDEVEKILREVDLAEFAKRKPNTLSGGQRQRVAIARALVKNPEIIMADEPTGALDSQTGKQVFDTLKRLSAHKLVIVVSHDRDFAEEYADRIIELKDGKIISDVSKTTSEATGSGNVRFVGENTISIRQGSLLTQEDLARINRFLADSPQDIIITNGAQEVDSFRKAAHIDEQGASSTFEHTDETRIAAKTYSQEEQAFIRSRLPLRQAIRIGASSMKVKPVRLFFTIFLCFIAFTMFGLFSTLTFFSRAQTSMRTYRDLGFETLTLQNNYSTKVTYYSDNKITDVSYTTSSTKFRKEDYEKFREQFGADVLAVYDFGNYGGFVPSNSVPLIANRSYYYFHKINAFAAVDPSSSWKDKLVTDTDLSALTENDIIVSTYFFESIKNAGLYETPSLLQKYTIETYDDLVGKTLIMPSRTNPAEGDRLTVRGIFRADPPEQYAPLKELSDIEKENETLSVTFNLELNYGLYRIAFVSDQFYDAHYESLTPAPTSGSDGVKFFSLGDDITLFDAQGAQYSRSYWEENSWPPKNSAFPKYVARLDHGDPRTPLQDGELIVPFALLAEQLTPLIEQRFEEMNASGDPNATKWLNDVSQNAQILLKGRGHPDIPTTETMISSALETFYDVLDLLGQSYSPTVTLRAGPEGNQEKMRIVGFYYADSDALNDGLFFSEDDFSRIREQLNPNVTKDPNYSVSTTKYSLSEDAIYKSIIVPVSDNNHALRTLLQNEQKVNEADDTLYSVNSVVTYQIDAVEYVMSMLELIFLIVGVVMALLAMLLLFNFISVSISNKKKEIGILRAVGARGADVFKIFFSEAAIIGLVCYVLSVIACFILCGVMNNIVATMLPVTLFIFGPLSWLVMLAIAVLTCLLATFLPVRSAAKRRPVESIRAL